jgi:hypothetical protein
MPGDPVAGAVCSPPFRNPWSTSSCVIVRLIAGDDREGTRRACFSALVSAQISLPTGRLPDARWKPQPVQHDLQFRRREQRER